MTATEHPTRAHRSPRRGILRCVIAALLCLPAAAACAGLTRFVNPLIGTGAIDGGLLGNNYPGATIPFGMVQLSPDTREAPDWDCAAGYDYNDRTVYGFSHTRLSGTGASDLIDILLLPVTRPARRAAFSHDEEQAAAGYYAVRLRDEEDPAAPGVLAELTATTHTGVHRYTYPAGAQQLVYLDLDHSAAKGSWGRRIEWAQLRLTDPCTVEGYRIITGWAPLRKVCFSIRFSRPVVAYDLWNDGRHNVDSLLAATAAGSIPFTANGTDLKATLALAPADEPLEVCVGLSAVSVENARQNREAETAGKHFDDLRAAADAAWEEVLGTIRADFPTDEEGTIFYTAMYHAMIQPNQFSDVCGDYVRGDYAVGRSDTPVYTTFSLWDTFRAAHALYDLLQPGRARDMVNSMLGHAETYGYLPIWELWGEDNYCMIGNHAVSVVVEAIEKGVPGIDEERAWRAVDATLTTAHRDSPWGVWERLGYMPENVQTQSVSITLEDSYDAWCAARLARRLGHEAAAAKYERLARNYRNLYNPESGLFQPRDDQGRWLEGFDALRYGANGGSAFTEGNAWQWRWSVQHDVPGLVELSGGQKAFCRQLDYFFTSTDTSGEKNDNASGFIGLYAHGNEPSHHVAFLYRLAGQPAKTDQLVTHIRRTLYDTTQSGYAGNDDCGEMSAWYVFAALGFYPVCPASAEYVLCAPAVDHAQIALPQGRTLTVHTRRRSPRDVYVKAVRLNGVRIAQPTLTHAQLLEGGVLEFELTARPQGPVLPL